MCTGFLKVGGPHLARHLGAGPSSLGKRGVKWDKSSAQKRSGSRRHLRAVGSLCLCFPPKLVVQARALRGVGLALGEDFAFARVVRGRDDTFFLEAVDQAGRLVVADLEAALEV